MYLSLTSLSTGNNAEQELGSLVPLLELHCCVHCTRNSKGVWKREIHSGIHECLDELFTCAVQIYTSTVVQYTPMSEHVRTNTDVRKSQQPHTNSVCV